jgi:hypothetical protein
MELEAAKRQDSQPVSGYDFVDLISNNCLKSRGLRLFVFACGGRG